MSAWPAVSCGAAWHVQEKHVSAGRKLGARHGNKVVWWASQMPTLGVRYAQSGACTLGRYSKSSGAGSIAYGIKTCCFSWERVWLAIDDARGKYLSAQDGHDRLVHARFTYSEHIL
jgi:hypothetical protein